MSPDVWSLLASTAKRKKLITHVDKNHEGATLFILVAASKFECEDAGIELQRFFDIAYLQGDMVETNKTRMLRLATVPRSVRRSLRQQP